MKPADFVELSPTTLADCLPREQIMQFALKPLWACPRIAGPAFTVRCLAGDNLMLHAAIYRAPPGSVIVAEAGDSDYALAGGNVCAVAQKNGVAGFVIDGVIRDLAEVRERGFPVFAKGVSPKPGTKKRVGSMGDVVKCAGVRVATGDMVVADEEGIVVVPQAELSTVLTAARARAAADAAQSLEAWERDHRRKIDEALAGGGFAG